MKRQLLETSDWAAVGAARPVQVAFTPEEDLEKFGKRRRLTKDDHERLNTNANPSTAILSGPRATEEGPWNGNGNVLEGLEIRIDGRRLAEQTQPIGMSMDGSSHDHHNTVSSQSMLLDEDLFDEPSNQRVGAGSLHHPRRDMRSVSERSMISTGPQPESLSENPFVHGSQASNQLHLAQQRRVGSDSMDWESDDRIEPQQNTGSSSIVPQPGSPVRRRFTIDEQAIAERGRFLASSPVAEPSAKQHRYHGQAVQESPEARNISSYEHSSQTFEDKHLNRRATVADLHRAAEEGYARDTLQDSPQKRPSDIHWNHGIVVPPAPRPAFSELAWSPWGQMNNNFGYSMTQSPNRMNSSWSSLREEAVSPRSTPRSEHNRFARSSLLHSGNQTNMSWGRSAGERASPTRVYGQAVVFEDSNVDANNGRARRLSELLELDHDTNHNPSYLSEDPYESRRRVPGRFN
ncbi:hypothetical protein BDV18DRAFT_156309 [Aspergillus unguis]